MTISGINGITSFYQAQAKKTGQNVPSSLFPDATATPASGAAKDFTDYMSKTPAQQMQDSWLKQHGITQQQFDAMSSADKQKILDEMKRELEQKMEDKAKQDSKTDILV